MPREGAEQLRKRLARRGMVQKDRRIFDRDGFVLIPLADTADLSFVAELGGEVVEGEAVHRTTYRSPYEVVLETVNLPEVLKPRLPRRFELLGDVVLVRLPPELLPYRKEIGRAYAHALGARTVVRESALIHGAFRAPEVEILYGNGTETVHFENGIYYKLDVSKVMFSSGNIDEKLHMASLDCRGETVVDMFAGIGYFTLPLAVHAKASRIIACEINPDAFHYLQENVRLNGVEDIVEPFHGDNRELLGEGIADRVVMGYVGTTHRFLPKAFSLVKKGGVIHYQDTFPLVVFPQQAYDRLDTAAGTRSYQILRVHEVKSYSPGVSHMVMDVLVMD